MEMKAAVKIIKLSKSFNREQILKEISHSFEAGKIHGIMGFNGSGKTVMFKCICGFLRPDSGYVKVMGKRIGKDVDFPESLGMIIENPGFLPHLSGYANLKRLADLRKKIGREEVIDAIIRVGLDPFSKKHVSQYSLGMRERLGIAQAIMEDPELLILDEPFNGLDKCGVAEVCELLQELRERGKTILLAAHNMPDMEGLCDTICEMDAGVLTTVQPSG
ncbi:ABC transporter ATP-binding protein [Mediterraneibacter agrestimuris]